MEGGNWKYNQGKIAKQVNIIENILFSFKFTRDFGRAIEEWEYFVEKTQSTHGIKELIEDAFKNNMDNVDELRIDIGKKMRRLYLNSIPFIRKDLEGF